MTQQEVDRLQAEANRLFAIYEPLLDAVRKAEALEGPAREDWRIAQNNFMNALNELEEEQWKENGK